MFTVKKWRENWYKCNS